MTAGVRVGREICPPTRRIFLYKPQWDEQESGKSAATPATVVFTLPWSACSESSAASPNPTSGLPVSAGYLGRMKMAWAFFRYTQLSGLCSLNNGWHCGAERSGWCRVKLPRPGQDLLASVTMFQTLSPPGQDQAILRSWIMSRLHPITVSPKSVLF